MTPALTAGLSAAFLGRAFLPRLLELLGALGEIFPKAPSYIGIILPRVPFHVIGVGQNSTVRAEGNARVADMALDPLFIFGFGRGIAGAAWAKVAFQALGKRVPALSLSISRQVLLSPACWPAGCLAGLSGSLRGSYSRSRRPKGGKLVSDRPQPEARTRP